MSDGTPFLRVAADRIGTPGSPAKNAIPRHQRRQSVHNHPDARRWPSFEDELHVERFRITLNGLGGFHMGNPGSNQSYTRKLVMG